MFNLFNLMQTMQNVFIMFIMFVPKDINCWRAVAQPANRIMAVGCYFLIPIVSWVITLLNWRLIVTSVQGPWFICYNIMGVGIMFDFFTKEFEAMDGKIFPCQKESTSLTGEKGYDASQSILFMNRMAAMQSKDSSEDGQAKELSYVNQPREFGSGAVRIGRALPLGPDLYSLFFVSYMDEERMAIYLAAA